MPGQEYEALLGIVNQICSELGARPSGAGSPPFAGGSRYPVGAELSPEDEQFVAAMRKALAELASAAGGGSLDDQRRQLAHAALDGAELVTRGQVALGRAQQLRTLLPSFVFLIALPIVQQDEALSLSRRAGELATEAFSG